MCWSAGASLFFGVLGVVCASFLYIVGKAAEEKPGESVELPGGKRIANLWTSDAKWHALWVLNIAFVELSEFVIWLNVLPFDDEIRGGTECPTWNKIGTFGVFTFGFCNWSWLIGVWCHGTTASSQPLRRKMYSLWRVFAIIVSVSFWIQLLLGEFTGIGVRHVANLSAAEIEQFGITRPVYYRITTDIPLPLGTSLARDLPETVEAQIWRLRGKPVKTCSYQEVGRYPHLHWRFAWAEEPWLPSSTPRVAARTLD